MTISNNPLTSDLLLGIAASAWLNSNIRDTNFAKRPRMRHQTFGFVSGIVHCNLQASGRRRMKGILQ
jgi:hypothetical protein